ncbi:MAG: heme oxygenase [Sphingobacteriales bacterium]|nr:heme oxygenase [Sphingobacteriales bacterium]
MKNIQQLQTSIEPLRQQIINHKVYSVINELEDLKIFMQYHIYAVWDFMSLLKALQNNLTCTSVPWFPVGSADTRHLINEIVVGEESDIDIHGIRKSHFEIYLDAMGQCGADTTSIATFLAILQSTKKFNFAFTESSTPEPARNFVEFTFKVINSNKAHLQAAIFTFGREDLIPEMFYSIINDLDKKFPESISRFKYYLERHIEVDGDHHSHLALQMTSNLCESDPEYWKEAEQITIESLKMRMLLWDGIYNEIMARKAECI